MAKSVVMAQVKIGDEVKAGKRTVELYDNDADVTVELIADANRGLVLREQASIRQALKARYGGGTTAAPRDLSAAEEV